MNEVTGLLIAVGAMFGGLLLLGWACGDFNRPPRSASKTEDTTPGTSS